MFSFSNQNRKQQRPVRQPDLPGVNDVDGNTSMASTDHDSTIGYQIDSGDDVDEKHRASHMNSAVAGIDSGSTSASGITPKAKGGATHLTLNSIRFWDVDVPPVKKHVVGGKLVPTTSGRTRGFKPVKRRITIELYTDATSRGKKKPKNVANGGTAFGELLKGISSDDLKSGKDSLELAEKDMVILRVMKSAPGRELNRNVEYQEGEWESHYMSDWALSACRDVEEGIVENGNRDFGQWNELKRTGLQEIELDRHHTRTVDLQMGVGDRTVVQGFIFGSTKDANTFVKVVNNMKKLQRERSRRLAAAHRAALAKKNGRPLNAGGTKQTGRCGNRKCELPRFRRRNKSWQNMDFSDDQMANLLIEIVSASNLPASDILSTNPYIVVRDGPRDIHQTKSVSKTFNPVWTISSASIFLLESTVGEFFARSNVLEFIVMDHGGQETLGTVMVNKTDLLNGRGKRKAFQIMRPPTVNTKRIDLSKRTPYLYLRYRSATEHDIDFMRTFEKNRKSMVDGVYSRETSVPPKHHPPRLLQRISRHEKGRPVQYRVKPFPNPKIRGESEWMTKAEIEKASLEHSESWVESGSGNIGRVHLEVLRCDGLRNLARAPGDKSDPFVCVIHEDCIVNTDVINDCLSPRWMPWSQRAFVFNIMNPSSQIFIGVFDFNQGFPEPTHDPLGRTVVNLTNCRPDSIYTLIYNLYDSDDLNRKLHGTITIRVRIDFTNQRRALLCEFGLRDHYNVSTVQRSDFKCAYYTLTNDKHHQSLSLNSITLYIKELQGYLGILDYVTDTMTTVLFWRGHYRLPMCGCNIMLPLNSIVSFSWGILIANDPERLVSFFFFLIGWFLIATMDYERNQPSPWRRPRSYMELLAVLVFNKTFSHPQIESFENAEEIERYQAECEDRENAKKEAYNKLKTEKEIQQKQLEIEGEKLNEEMLDITTRAGDDVSQLILAPFKSALWPVQKALFQVCRALRVTSSIVTWRDSFVAFWIATFSFSASILVIWIPWAFLIKWSFKIFVYVILGPWMKLADIYLTRKDRSTSEEERLLKMEARYEKRYNLVLGKSSSRLVLKEDAAKIKDIEKYMFGKYIMRVPIFKEERFPAFPCISSSSERYNPDKAPPIVIVDKKFGQHLNGVMIPQRHTDVSLKDKSTGDRTPSSRNSETAPLLESPALTGTL